MTIYDAKFTLGLRETDEPTREGLETLINMRESLIKQSASDREKRRARKEIKAANKLISWIDSYGHTTPCDASRKERRLWQGQ